MLHSPIEGKQTPYFSRSLCRQGKKDAPTLAPSQQQVESPIAPSSKNTLPSWKSISLQAIGAGFVGAFIARITGFNRYEHQAETHVENRHYTAKIAGNHRIRVSMHETGDPIDHRFLVENNTIKEYTHIKHPNKPNESSVPLVKTTYRYDDAGHLVDMVSRNVQQNTTNLSGTAWDKQGELVSWSSIGLDKPPDWQTLDVHDILKNAAPSIRVHHDNFLLHHYSQSAQDHFKHIINVESDNSLFNVLDADFRKSYNQKLRFRTKGLKSFTLPPQPSHNGLSVANLLKSYPEVLQEAEAQFKQLPQRKLTAVLIGAFSGISIYMSAVVIELFLKNVNREHQTRIDEQDELE